MTEPSMRNELTAVSPLDGRYARHTAPLTSVVSEFGLIRYRLQVEVEWLKTLAGEKTFGGLRAFTPSMTKHLDSIVDDFDVVGAARIKEIEQSTNHDVKAVEYYLREAVAGKADFDPALPFIHFACTSEDINNLAYGMMLKEARDKCLVPAFTGVITRLRTLATEFADDAMLARTHGQSATPTTVGKELANVVARLERQMRGWDTVSLSGKSNGAVGNYNAHRVACPDTDWPQVTERFVNSLGLEFNPYTTQIEPHDCIAEYADALARLNTILIDLSRDLWSYISIGYFKQRTVAGEVGSSTMPHKVNPIDFENAEGNLGLAAAMLDHFARKLPLSRLQRDLTDSTVLRNLGSALGYSLIALRSLDKGLGKLELDRVALADDLDKAWEGLAEPVQTVMRFHGIADSYEQLKELTRGRDIDRVSLHRFIDGLTIPDDAKATLKSLTPATYTGLASGLARDV